MSARTLLICAPCHRRHGGVESLLADLCRELPKRGWEVVLALGSGSRFNDMSAFRREYPDLPIIEMDGRKGTRQSRLESVVATIRKVRPDIVLSARLFDVYRAIAVLKGLGGGPRFAITIRGYEAQYFADARVYRGQVDLCVTCGQMIRMAAVRWSGLPEDRVVSIPVGVRPPRVEVLPRRGGNVLRIGYVGRLEQLDKRVFDLVSLLDKLEQRGCAYRMRIVGTGPDEIALRERLASMSWRGNVGFEGWRTHEELYGEVFPNLDCIVNCSATEGVTTSPREAMIHGVVPVLSQFVGLRTEGVFVHERNALTFPVGDLDTAAANIYRLATEPGLLRRLSQAAMASQTGSYLFASAMDAWAAALDRCCTSPARLGEVPNRDCSIDGRLARAGVPPWLAQRLRDGLGVRFVHGDPGSEWPQSSGLCDEDSVASVRRFAENYESGLRGCAGRTG